MKILITYFSNTGNTEKVAKSIHEGLNNEEVDMKRIKDVETSSLKNYDMIFLGSGIYAGKVNKSLSGLVGAAEELSKNFAFFCTHASQDSYQNGFKVVKRKLEKTNSTVLGTFDCMGENTGIPEKTIKSMMEKLPPGKQKAAQEHQNRLKGRPNAEDLNRAKEFAQNIVKKL